MTHLDLTKDERALLVRVANDPHSVKSRLGFYASVMAPLLGFCAYGFVKRDFIAEFIAFAGLFLFMAWRISQEFRRLAVYKSLLCKIAAHEKLARDA